MNRDREIGIWPELKRKPKPQFINDELSYINIKPNGLSQRMQSDVVTRPQKKMFKDLFEIEPVATLNN